MKKTLLAIGIIFILAMGVFFVTSPATPRIPGEGNTTNEYLPISAVIMTEQGAGIKVRIADDVQKRTLGLSYFKNLPDDQGMLFVFDKPDKYAFWMKDMNFPLDILWLQKSVDQEYKIVHLERKVSPHSYPKSFQSNTIADAVLEINSGMADVYNLALGKKMWISFE